ncbi:MAG: polysaccharide biosynthesis protein [Ruminococcaceae bacterium]|nr:polysaccharide biosynthesis protein [Oscillospiraceae bacterium]
MNTSKKKKGLLSGALALAMAGLAVKVIGLIYKIPLTNLIKSEGMGYFNSAYTIYTFFYMVSTAGLPVAISLLISSARSVGNRPRVKKIFLVSGVTFFTVGTLGSLGMFFFADFFAKILGNEPAALSIKAISPTLFFVSVISVLRGYFQGHQYMLPTAISQIAEAAGKLGFGMFFALCAIKKGESYEAAASGAALGLSIGMGIALLCLVIMALFFRSEKYYEQVFDTLPAGSTLSIMKGVACAALPITLSASVLSMSGTLDLITVMRTLKKIGLSAAAANAAYGNYSALALPMLNLPIVFITPIANTVVPYIAGLISKKDEKKVASSVSVSMRLCALISFPCALGLCALALPILSMLFDDFLAQSAAPLLQLLAPSVVFLSFATVTNALLQALGKPMIPVLSMFAGAGIKMISGPILIKRFAVSGAPMSTFLCYFTVCFINFAFIYKRIGERPRLAKNFASPLFSSLACALAAACTYSSLCGRVHLTLSCGISITVAAAVYVLLIILTRYLNSEDLLALFPSEKALKISQKIGFLKISKGSTDKNERNRNFERKKRA